uniref:Uncharacterized protein n=1 Tax=Avena sativa TaxID=4498 RepID=A0ACD5WST7_AVESA
MVNSGCHAVGMVTSLFRRCYNRRRGYEPIPPCEAEEKGGSGKAQVELCDGEEEEDDDEDGCKKELYEEAAVWKKIKEEGESDEACGDRLLDRSRSGGGTSFAAYKDLHYAAFFYAQAGSWRNAALAYGELAAYCRKTGRELSTGSALLRSAKCYSEIEDRGLEDLVATKLALDEALPLFVSKGDLWLAAITCSELAEFHMDRNELHSALVSYQRAAGYHEARKPGYGRDSMLRADHVRFLLANQEALRAKGELPINDYKGKSTGYMKPTDQDWSDRVVGLFSTTSIAHDRYYLRGLFENFLYVSLLSNQAPGFKNQDVITV